MTAADSIFYSGCRTLGDRGSAPLAPESRVGPLSNKAIIRLGGWRGLKPIPIPPPP